MSSNRRRKRLSQRNIILKEVECPVESSGITRWSEEETEKYLACIREHGHKNINKLEELFPNKSKDIIKTHLRTAFDISIRENEGHSCLEGWLQHCKMSTPWKDCIQIAQVMKYLSVDGLIENHPLPSQCQGINFPEAYRLIYQALMGYPFQPVNQETCNFVLNTLNELASEIRKETVAKNNLVDFLKFKFMPSESKTECGSEEKAHSSQNEIKVIKPGRVYQRKRQKLSNDTPSLNIIVEANEISTNRTGTKDYSVTIINTTDKGCKDAPTVINVPVPVRMDTLGNMGENEQELLKSETYNPLQLPQKWLKEPLFIHLMPKNNWK